MFFGSSLLLRVCSTVEIDELIQQFEMKLTSERDRAVWKRLVEENRQIETRADLQVLKRPFVGEWVG